LELWPIFVGGTRYFLTRRYRAVTTTLSSARHNTIASVATGFTEQLSGKTT
jgi:hypothetical protein